MRRKQKALKPDKYLVNGELRTYTAADFQRYANDTNKAISEGFSIPLLEKHVPVGTAGDGPQKLDASNPGQESGLINRGWLKGLEVDNDGWLIPEFDITDPDVAKGIENGSIKFTSPAFIDNYVDGHGRQFGDITRHFSVTAKPRSQNQGPFVPVEFSEMATTTNRNAVEFSLDDIADDKEKPEGDKGPEENSDPSPEPEAKNPDMPAKATDKTKVAAVIACMSQLGAELPSDFDFASDSAIDILLAALKTLAKSKSEAEQKPEEPEAPETQEAQAPVQFSEDELSKLPPAIAAALRERETLRKKAVEFAEEKATFARNKSLSDLKAMQLPPGLSSKLVSRLEAVNFSESGEPATLTVLEAAKLFRDSIPAGVLFDEGDTTESAPPEGGEKFFRGEGPPTTEEAKKINDEWDQAIGYKRSA